MEKNGYIVAIDLGTSNVVMAVGERSPEGLRVASLVSMPCQGVNAGQIENIKSVTQAIGEAKEEVQQQLGIRITEAYAGISGQFVRCASHKDYVFTADKLNGVSQTDVDRLFDRMRNVQAPNDEVVMERIPQNYMTDNNTEVRNPVGSFSAKLTSTFNFILCAQTPMQRLELALKNCGIVLKGIFPNAQVVPEAVLGPEEKEEGVAVIDLGGGLTDVAVYWRSVLRYVATIPLGGNAINRDIRSQSIAEKHVETLKCRYGAALAELAPDTLVHITGRTARESKDIPRRNLATIIEARLHDIVEYVVQELQNSGYYSKLSYGLVLTGGTARMQGIDELFRRTTDFEVRIADRMEGFDPESGALPAAPEYATIAGLLLRGSEQGICMTPQLSDEEWTRHREEQERLQREEEERQRAEQEAREQQEALQRQQAEEKRLQAEEKRRQLLSELGKLDAEQPGPAGTGQPRREEELRNEETRRRQEEEAARRREAELRKAEEERLLREEERRNAEADTEEAGGKKKRNVVDWIRRGINTLNEGFKNATDDDDEI